MQKGFPWHSPQLSHKELMGEMIYWEYMNQLFKNVFLNLKINPEMAEQLSKQVKNSFLDIKYWHLFDDVISVLKELKGMDFTNVILSNHLPELEEIVMNLGIRPYFDQIFSSGNIGYEKPNKNAFMYAIQRLENPENVIMIGDSYDMDVQGAINVGIPAILVRKDNKNQYPNYCRDLRNLNKLILNMDK